VAVSALNLTNRSGERALSFNIKDGTTGAVLSKRFGAVSVPDLGLSFTYGTGSGQANKLYYASRTVATVTADNLDLAGSLADGLGNTITFTSLKLMLFAVLEPDGTDTLRIGPRNQSNPFQGPWGGTGATVYQDVTHHWYAYAPVAGWTVTAGTGDILGVYNPSAGSVTYSVLLVGV
jgi:hypothetical protein